MGDNQFTQDVAQRGLAAFDQRWQANNQNVLDQNRAFDESLRAQGGDPNANPYVAPGVGHGSAAYDSWSQQQGFAPDYGTVNYGRTAGGKYSGYKNEADMWGALRGQAESYRHADQAHAAQLTDKAQSFAQQIHDQYAKALTSASTQTRGGATATPQQTQYKEALNRWLVENGNKAIDARDFATQVGQTPGQQYAVKAGRGLGLDPMLVLGRYPDASNLKDYSNQRDLASLGANGMTYGEWQSALAQQTAQQGRDASTAKSAAADQVEADWTNLDQFTGNVSAKALAQGAKMTQNQVGALVTTPEYRQLRTKIEGLMGTKGAVAKILADPSQFPNTAMRQVLTAQYGWAS